MRLKPSFTIGGIAALTLATPAAAQAPTALPATFTLNVSITPAARAFAARARKNIKMDVVYEGEPKPRFIGQANAETGYIPLGQERMEIPPAGSSLTLGRGLNRGRLHMLAKPVDVQVSVFVGEGGTDFLHCTGPGLITSDIVTTATFANFARAPRTITCTLPKR